MSARSLLDSGRPQGTSRDMSAVGTAVGLDGKVGPDTSGWEAVCPVARIVPDTGVAALIDGTQVAVFRLYGDQVYAIGNRDPFSGASVLSRGIVGDHGGQPYVASPIHKQRFDLATGICVDDDTVSVPAFETRVTDGCIEVRAPRPAPDPSSRS
jgi:nitrite reductase (NADH) small subunit